MKRWKFIPTQYAARVRALMPCWDSVGLTYAQKRSLIKVMRYQCGEDLLGLKVKQIGYDGFTSCLTVQVNGMLIGIERNGYPHS